MSMGSIMMNDIMSMGSLMMNKTMQDAT